MEPSKARRIEVSALKECQEDSPVVSELRGVADGQHTREVFLCEVRLYPVRYSNGQVFVSSNLIGGRTARTKRSCVIYGRADISYLYNVPWQSSPTLENIGKAPGHGIRDNDNENMQTGNPPFQPSLSLSLFRILVARRIHLSRLRSRFPSSFSISKLIWVPRQIITCTKLMFI